MVRRSCPREEIFPVLLIALSQVTECCSVSLRIPNFTCWTCTDGFPLLGSSIPVTTAGSAAGCPATVPVGGDPEHRLQTPGPLASLHPPPPYTFLLWKASPRAHRLLDHPISCWYCSCSLQGCVVPVGAWWGGWGCHCEGFRCALLQTIAVCPHYICPY